MAMRSARKGLLVGIILGAVAALVAEILGLRAELGKSPWVAAEDASANQPSDIEDTR